jgi:hypothetical protein
VRELQSKGGSVSFFAEKYSSGGVLKPFGSIQLDNRLLKKLTLTDLLSSMTTPLPQKTVPTPTFYL